MTQNQIRQQIKVLSNKNSSLIKQIERQKLNQMHLENEFNALKDFVSSQRAPAPQKPEVNSLPKKLGYRDPNMS